MSVEWDVLGGVPAATRRGGPAREWFARSAALDGARGAAVLLMLLDHLLVVTGHGDLWWVRSTVTRAAMPGFMVIGGALVSGTMTPPRLARLVRTIAFGVALPVVVPWIDDPNILVMYAAGWLLVWAVRRWTWGAPLLVIVGATLAGNGLLGHTGAGYYPIGAVAALMAAGAWIGPVRLGSWLRSFAARRLRPVQWLGRHALAFYVLHLLVLRFLQVGGVL